MKSAFLTDKEVQTILRISGKTLAAVMRNGPSRGCHVDLRKVKPIRIGGERSQRRWSVGRFAEVTGITREEIWATLS